MGYGRCFGLYEWSPTRKSGKNMALAAQELLRRCNFNTGLRFSPLFLFSGSQRRFAVFRSLLLRF